MPELNPPNLDDDWRIAYQIGLARRYLLDATDALHAAMRMMPDEQHTRIIEFIDRTHTLAKALDTMREG